MNQHQPNLTFIERTGNIWFLMLPMALGVTIFLIGLHPSLNEWKDLLVGIGGTLFGSALGTFFGLATGTRLALDVRQLHLNMTGLFNKNSETMASLQREIEQSILSLAAPPFVVNENQLKANRRQLHYYYRTRIDGEEFWMYVPLDFSRFVVEGKLFERQITKFANREYTYEYHGYIIDDRLIILNRAVTINEKSAIYIFPDFGTGLDAERGNWGITLHVDWDKLDGLDPCILSHVILDSPGVLGRQAEATGTELLKKWQKLAPKVGIKSAQ